jgi:hypothetical protein
MAAPIDASRIEAAMAAFPTEDLNPAERAVASTRLCVDALRTFRKEVATFRQQVGDEAAAEFARTTLNDLIYDLQDVIPPTVRAYNALLRDLEQKLESPDE